MIRSTFVAIAAAAYVLWPQAGAARTGPEVDSRPPAAAGGSVSADVAPCGDCLVIPALTPVRIELLVTLGSKISKSGETFPLRLAEAVVVDGREVVPAGTPGMGEVVHAKKSGGSGAAGELVLAARYLEVGGQRLRLRSLRVVANGRSNINGVNALNLASAAAPLPIGLVGFLIKGGQTTIEQGTIADAKTAQPFVIGRSAAAPAATLLAPAPASGAASVPQERGKMDDS